jgi:hypothetical protein
MDEMKNLKVIHRNGKIVKCMLLRTKFKVFQ